MENTIFDVFALEKKYLELTAQKAVIEQELKEISQMFLNESAKTGEMKFLGETKAFTICADNTQMRFDTKTFKQDYADLYNQYAKPVKVKAYMKATEIIRDKESGVPLYEDV